MGYIPVPVYPIYKYSRRAIYYKNDEIEENDIFTIALTEEEAKSIIVKEIDRLNNIFCINNPFLYKRTIDKGNKTIRFDPINPEDEFHNEIWIFWYKKCLIS